MKLFLLTNCRWLALVVAGAAGLILASQLLTTCDTKQTGELNRRDERRVKAKLTNSLTTARADSARARLALAHAQAALDSANVYRDSLTYYRQHEKDIIYVSAADTAHYQGVLSDIFGR